MRCDLAILSVNEAETEAMSYEIFRERLWQLRYLHVAVKGRLLFVYTDDFCCDFKGDFARQFQIAANIASVNGP